VHRTFNASIPRHHIPIDQWEFEYGLTVPQDDEFMVEDDTQEEGVESSGYWIHKVTGDKLGGPDGSLEFTVIGYAV
jgi:DNA-directed RNA polymerase I subunit RPA43